MADVLDSPSTSPETPKEPSILRGASVVKHKDCLAAPTNPSPSKNAKPSKTAATNNEFALAASPMLGSFLVGFLTSLLIFYDQIIRVTTNLIKAYNSLIQQHQQLESVLCCISLSVIGFIVVYVYTPLCSPLFIRAGLKGRDLCKKNSNNEFIAEGLGVFAGAVYISILSFMLPVMSFKNGATAVAAWRRNNRIEIMLAGILSISLMCFLGFADNVLDLRWRVKLLLPFFASLPIILVYATIIGETHVLFPDFVNSLLGLSTAVDIGKSYYLLLIFVVIFCTNSINILAGINGLEVGQSIVLAVAGVVNNIIQILRSSNNNSFMNENHFLSLIILFPFLAVSVGLFLHNKFPASVFVGDAYTYFSGMTLAVSGIVGQCVKTMLLFFVPQIFNFILSLPQLFKIIPCPRHRLPRISSKDGGSNPSEDVLLTCSMTHWMPVDLWIKNSLSGDGVVDLRTAVFSSVKIWTLKLLLLLRLVRGEIYECNEDTIKLFGKIDGKSFDVLVEAEIARNQSKTDATEFSTSSSLYRELFLSNEKQNRHRLLRICNLTSINLCLHLFGDMTEKALCNLLLFFNCCWCLIAFYIRYGLARFFYTNVH